MKCTKLRTDSTPQLLNCRATVISTFSSCPPFIDLVSAALPQIFLGVSDDDDNPPSELDRGFTRLPSRTARPLWKRPLALVAVLIYSNPFTGGDARIHSKIWLCHYSIINVIILMRHVPSRPCLATDYRTFAAVTPTRSDLTFSTTRPLLRLIVRPLS